MATIEVTSGVLDRLVSAAEEGLPEEACGLLLGRGGKVVDLRPARNVHPAPERHFEIDPQALIDAHREARWGGPEILGYYHSHPTGSAEPSAHDRAGAANDGSIWAIIANGTVRFWLAGDGSFTELSTAPHKG